MINIIDFTPGHLDHVLKHSDTDVFSPEQLLASYQSPGSLSFTIMKDSEIIACCGIVNFQYNRGEAWMIPAYRFRENAFSVLKLFKAMLPTVAAQGGFRRIQATGFNNDQDKYFEILGFEKEGVLKSYGPQGEDVTMYAQVFEGANNV